MAQQSTANPVYEDFEPTYDWAQDQACKTLILKLPGFRRDQLKVQVVSNRKLKIRGERQMSENKWRRFSKEFALDSDVHINKIGARFSGDNLYVNLPKVNQPQGLTPPHQVPKPQQLPKAEAPPIQKPDQRKAPEEVPRPKPKEDKAKAEAKADEIAQKKKEQKDGKEKGKIEADANKVAQERKQGNMEADANKEAQNKKSPNELDQEAKATAPTAQEKHETVGGWGQGEAKVDQRLPTRVLRLNSTAQQYKEALVGLIVVAKKQSKLTNLIVAIFLVLVLGLCVKNATKSYSGGAKIQEL